MNTTASTAISPGSSPANSPHVRDGIEAVGAALTALLGSPTVSKMLNDLKVDDARTLAEQRMIAEIPAPPFQESAQQVQLASSDERLIAGARALHIPLYGVKG